MSRDRPTAIAGAIRSLRLSRRGFVVAAGGSAASLCLGLDLRADAAPGFREPQLAAFLEITPDDVVRIVTPDLEFGRACSRRCR